MKLESESEFLKEYNINEFEQLSVATDIVAFTISSKEDNNYRRDNENTLSILLIQRGEHPYLNSWALPGGFLRPDETIEECALREIIEETNVAPAALIPIAVFSDLGRDPRGRIISNAFASIISEDNINTQGGYDAKDAKWFDVEFEQDNDGLYHLILTNEATRLESTLKLSNDRILKNSFEIIEAGSLAFDHAKIIATAISKLRREAENIDIIFDFLPEKFTLTSMQKVQETIMNITLLPANFRRKISNLVVETDEYTSGAGHRPSKLFTRK